MNRAVVEILESRRLLSVAPAVHTHPMPPAIDGITYVGSLAAKSGVTGTLSIQITSESKSGKLGGVVAISVAGTPFTLRITGSVNPKWGIIWHGSTGHKNLSATGDLNSDLTAMSGKFKYTARHGSTTGTFDASEVT